MPPPATTTRVGGREVEVIIVLPAWPLSVARASAPGTAAAAGKYGRPIAGDAHGRADDAGRPRVRPLRRAPSPTRSRRPPTTSRAVLVGAHGRDAPRPHPGEARAHYTLRARP